MTIDIDLFAGPGGWDEGVKHLGIRPVGYELGKAQVATATAAGHRRILCDIAKVRPMELPKDVRGQIASPPCQGFSMAGKGKGREDSLLLVKHLEHVTPENIDQAISWFHQHMKDDRSLLALEPLRWAFAVRPVWLAWEQVPGVLPLWEACAERLRAQGYSVATGILNAEQYGVPQTRRRAILVARRDGKEARLPTPTHSRYYSRTPERLDEGVRKWVSMAEALGWGGGVMRSNYGTGGDPKNRGERTSDEPAPTITSKADRNKWQLRSPQSVAGGPRAMRNLDEPSITVTGNWDGRARWREAVAAEVAPRMNNQSGTEFDLAWPLDRPAPVIAGRDLVTMPGANANRFNGATKSRNDGIRVSIQEAAVLQSFPADYPWQGTKSEQFQQVGDAVPPFLAYAIVKEITS